MEDLMIQMGNHMKLTIAPQLRERTREFYRDICEGRMLESPNPDLDLYEFGCGFVLGVFVANQADTLPQPDYIKAAWLELKVDDVPRYRAKLEAFGIAPLSYSDPTRMYFQAPGGQVFRLAPLDGGV